ncbi:methyltransferase domain-containing protein [Phenylobacterium sp.]|uniref:class I SAM-dependent methyltransferase n=1 Tax=Phenylobacterium sp. TaxID=1871053 RepID=UPI0025F2CD5D|nr:methyltransferase domain-containing protein [Phenylobacterium sp.]MBX3482844.1 methyltransferase domain-containing protein [Phenylobacterium sp.]MCW5758299.1 methyltransferase domain-containing protein [Phenylobacterium sp.]
MSDPRDASGARDLAAYEADYGAHAFEVIQARLRKRIILELMERTRPARILEVGCGSDTLANHWTIASAFTVVEPAPGFAETARRDTANVAGVEVIEGFLQDAAPRLAGRSFDLIVLSGLLQEVSDPGGLLQQVHGLCGDATTVHVNVPNALSMHRLLGVEMGALTAPEALSETQQRFQQFRTYTPETLQDEIGKAGFSVSEAGSYFIKPFTHAQMDELRRAGFLTETMLEGLWGLARHMPAHGSEIFVNARRAR